MTVYELFPEMIALILTMLQVNVALLMWGVMRSVSTRIPRWIWMFGLVELIVAFIAAVGFHQGLMQIQKGIEPIWVGCPAWVAIGLPVILFFSSYILHQLSARYEGKYLTHASVKEALDKMPTGLAFIRETGRLIFSNEAMQAIAEKMTGESLKDGNMFWDEILKRWSDRRVRLPDGTVWQMERTPLPTIYPAVDQISAVNVTEQAAIRKRLEEEIRKKKEINERLRIYGQNVTESTRQREILNTKIRIHDDLGHALLATRHCLENGQNPEEREYILRLWQQNRILMGGGQTVKEGSSSLDDLMTAANAVGVSIEIEGKMPKEGSAAWRLMETLLHESLTNTVKHAGGDKLFLVTHVDEDGILMEVTNNGAQPKSRIAEGGGLSMLRRWVEEVKGAMDIYVRPVFMIRVFLPSETLL